MSRLLHLCKHTNGSLELRYEHVIYDVVDVIDLFQTPCF